MLSDPALTGRRADSVAVDDVAGAYDAVSHILAGGYKRVTCITGSLSITTGCQRRAGYVKALEDAGRAVDESLVRVSELREPGGGLAMDALLGSSPRPDAVFVTKHLMTIGALGNQPNQVRYTEGRRGGPLRRYALVVAAKPPADGRAQPANDLGFESGRLLLNRVEGYTGAPRMVTLSPTLRIGESSLPKRRAAARRR